MGKLFFEISQDHVGYQYQKMDVKKNMKKGNNRWLCIRVGYQITNY